MGLLARLFGRRAGAKRAEADRLRRSGLVDEAFYRNAYPDLGRADPVEDYLERGAAAGRKPNPLFDTAWYLSRNPDVRQAGLNPLLHYLDSGAAEGRDPGPDFSTSFYLDADPALRAAGINPLVHYLGTGRAEGRETRFRPRETLDDYEAALLSRRSLAGAAELDHVHFPLRPPTSQRDREGRPQPPLDLARRIGAPTLSEFDYVGRETKTTLLRCVPPGLDLGRARVLDFGCGVGRVLRYFAAEAETGEVWGCDIDGPSIRWAVENLSPPFRLFQLSEIPTLPLESNSFDVVYAISVFAHIHADWHHWLAEVRRILKPGGTFIASFMAQTPFEEMLGRSYWDQGVDFGKYVQNPFADWNDGGPMAFHSPEWIKRFWGSLFDIEFIALDGLLEYQSLCVMRKPAPGPMRSREVPVLRRSCAQPFDPDAVGRIHERHDRSRTYLESFGVEAHDKARLDGWITFRKDRPAKLELTIDGEAHAGTTEFEPAGPYRDWAGSIQTAFAVEADLAGVEPGEHRAEVRITSAGGKTHAMTIPLLVR